MGQAAKLVGHRFLIPVVYVLVSSCLTVVNKVTFSFPGFTHVNLLVASQQICVLLGLLIMHLLRVVHLRTLMRPTRSLLAVIGSYVAYVLTSLQGLRFVSVPLYTTLRKLGILTTVYVEYKWHNRTVPRVSLLGIALIITGAIYAGTNDLTFHILGYSVCLICNVCTSVYLVSVSHHKDEAETDGTDIVFHCALYSFPIFLFCALLNGEFSTISRVVRAEAGFLSYFFVSSCMAGMLNVSTVLNVRMNSSIAQNICANMKDIVLVLASVGIGQSQLDLRTGVGVAFAMLGGFIYSFAGVIEQTIARVGPGVRIRCFANLDRNNVTFRSLLRATFVVVALVCVVAIPHHQHIAGEARRIYAVFAVSEESGHVTNQIDNLASVLAVVSGGWALEYWRDEAHILYLYQILYSYVSMCECGFKVHVVLVTYRNSTFDSWTKYIRQKDFECQRAPDGFSITAEFIDQKPLPSKAFGTSGALQAYHREIFERESGNYDYFIGQEDDVQIGCAHLKYHIDSSEALKGTHLRPGFAFLERSETTWYVDWRLNAGWIFMSNEEPYFGAALVISPGCCMYILSRSDVAALKASNELVPDFSQIEGEFNPQVHGYSSLVGKFQVVFPLKELERFAFHHLPNKYVQLPDRMPPRLTLDELDYVFQACINTTIAGNAQSGMSIQGDCKACLDERSNAYVTIAIENGIKRAVTVRFSCRTRTEEGFEQYFGKRSAREPVATASLS